MQVEICTARFLIRTLAEADLATFAGYRAQPAVAEYQSWTSYTHAEAEALLAGTREAVFGTAGHWFQLAILDRDDETLQGDLAVHFVDEEQIEVGFTIDPRFQKQGVASEALSAFLSFAFGDLTQHRVTARVDDRNLAAVRLLAKLGFRQEAHLIENVFFKGAWGSEFEYALLAREWEGGGT